MGSMISQAMQARRLTVEVNVNKDLETIVRDIRALIESDSALAIETFEIKNYDEDYLRMILDNDLGPTLVYHKMTNLKKLILKCDKTAANFDQEFPQSFNYLIHWFPKLELVELSALLVEKMKKRCGNNLKNFESKLKAILTCDFKLI